MSVRTAALSKDAPPPSPLMSQAVVCNGMVYCSGALGLDPKTGKFVEGTVKDRTAQAIRNLGAILEAAGSSLTKVVKVTIFLSSMDHYGQVNEAYAEYFTGDPKPSRTCVSVAKLPLDAEVEIELIASVA